MALVAWTALSASIAGGDAASRIALLGAVTGMYVAVRVVARRHRSLPLLLIVAMAALLALSSSGDVFEDHPLGQPLGYANANAALWGQAATAAALLWALARGRWSRLLAAGASMGFGALTVASGSVAAMSLLVLALVAAVASRRPALRRPTVVGAAILVGAALAVTIALGATYRYDGAQDGASEVAEASLSSRRLALWGDAIDLMVSEPVTGIGPARYRFESPIAAAQHDTREAHNEFLQYGAETGFVGLALVVALFGWAFVRLVAAEPDASVGIAAAAVAALGIHSTVDYILHFPIVPLAAAASVAVATRMQGNERPGPPEGTGSLPERN